MSVVFRLRHEADTTGRLDALIGSSVLGLASALREREDSSPIGITYSVTVVLRTVGSGEK